LWDANIKNVIVSFGLDISSQLLNFLLKIDPNEVILSFNNDEANNSAGNKAADKAFNKLNKYFDPKQIKIILPDKKDFGEMNKEEIINWQKKI
jgi:DNA primase